MSLAWSFAKVSTPYGDVTTAHWAVPDDEANEAAEASQQQKHLLEKAELSLETAEDELGAVLWNSNTVAANSIDQYFSNNNDKTSCDDKNNKMTVKMQNRRILELGAGVGCLGIGLAFGGCDVCVTDIPRLLPLMKINVDLNRSKLVSSGKGGKCFAASLAWEAKKIDADVENWWTAKKKSEENYTSQNKGTVPSSQKQQQQSGNNSINEIKRTIIMVDALYGNPKSWPFLIRLLENFMTQEDDEVINFCEQRVKGVEDGFLKLLSEDNDARRSSKSNNETNDKNKSEKRVWVWDLQELKEQSEMGMTIRRTVIRLVSEAERERVIGIGQNAKKQESKQEKQHQQATRRQREE